MSTLTQTAALLLLYLGAVSLGGYLLGEAAETLLGRVHARVVGGVLLGFTETLPEYLFAIASTVAHRNDVAVGSAFGGNIFLFTVPYGLLLLARGGRTLRYSGLGFDLVVLGASTALIVSASALSVLNIYVGVALIAIYAAFIVHAVHGNAGYEGGGSPVAHRRGGAVLAALLFASGLTLTVLFIEPLVVEVVAFSSQLGLPPIITSFTLVPVGDELPELVAMVTLLSSKNRVEGGGAANASLIGSKIQSNTLLLGTIIVAASVLGNPISIADRTSLFTLYAMAATTYMGMAASVSPRSKGAGLTLIASYIAVISLTFTLGI